MRLFRHGQSLVEILIGAALGVLLIAAGAALIAPALRTNTAVNQVQTRTELAKELSDNVKAWAAGNWNNLLSLATGTANTYSLNTTSSPFTVAGVSTTTVASTTYLRYFYLNDVYRDVNGNVTSTASGNYYDPSTKQITVVIGIASSTTPSSTYPFYLTRNTSNVFNQTSWAGGSGQNNPVTLVGTSYAAATSVSITATGSLQLAMPTGGTCQN
jgi:hypothetical protein